MDKTFLPYDLDQRSLLPTVLQGWLPPDHLIYFMSDVVDKLGLSPITGRYQGVEEGGPPYHPRMMVKVLVYGYCIGGCQGRRQSGPLGRCNGVLLGVISHRGCSHQWSKEMVSLGDCGGRPKQEEAGGYRRGLTNVQLVRGLRGSALPAVLEAVALPVHLQDVDVVGEPVQQRPC